MPSDASRARLNSGAVNTGVSPACLWRRAEKLDSLLLLPLSLEDELFELELEDPDELVDDELELLELPLVGQTAFFSS